MSWENPDKIRDKKDGNRFRNALADAMVRRGMNPKQVATIAGMKPQTLFSKKSGLPRGTTQPMYYDTLCRLDMALGLDKSQFVPEEHEEESFFKLLESQLAMAEKREDSAKIKEYRRDKDRQYFTREVWEKIKDNHSQPEKTIWEKFFPVNSPNFVNNKKLFNAYSFLADNYFAKANTNISIHHLLFVGEYNYPDRDHAYAKAQQPIFDAIEAKLKKWKACNSSKQRVRYTRIFYVSPNNHLFPRNMERDDWFIAFLCQVSTPVFEHVLRCLTEYAELCEFYIVSEKISFRSRAEIDSQFCIYEDYSHLGKRNYVERICVLDVSDNSNGRHLRDFNESNTHDVLRDDRMIKYNELGYFLPRAERFVSIQAVARQRLLELSEGSYKVTIMKPDPMKRLIMLFKESQLIFTNMRAVLHKKEVLLEKYSQGNESDNRA